METKDLKVLFHERYHRAIKDGRPSGKGGRRVAMELIEVCQQIDPGTDYGRLKYGMMNVEAINELAKKLGEF